MGTMDRLFRLMAEKKATDLFLSVGAPITIKINGNAVAVNSTILDMTTVRSLLGEILSPEQLEEFEHEKELQTRAMARDIGVYRLSCFFQRGTPAMVARYIPVDIPKFDSLGLPPILKEVIMEKRGLVLMVGATGSGKSTTLTSMIDHRNELVSGHILTLEDPLEFLFKNKKSIVNQREVGTDTKAFQIALKNALRQAPDVIFIGEIRDKDTMGQAIAYAQSGHLCMATLHANNSYHAMSRIITFYPLENRPALLADLAVTLKCVISQRLVKTLCPNCKQPYAPDQAELDELALEFGPGWEEHAKEYLQGKKTLYRKAGCAQCVGGYKGRVGVHELMVNSSGLKHQIKHRKPTEEIRAQAVTEGMLSLKQDGMLKVLEGLTDMDQVRAASG